MLRFKILASAVPLIVAGVFARGELFPENRACIIVGETSVQLAPFAWQAQLHVGFTSDPAAATVRVQIADSADAADFVVVDDIGNAEAGSCETPGATRLVAVAPDPAPSEPVIYLSQDGAADYRIFVRSRLFTARDVAALLVGAHASHARITAASL